MSDLEDISRKLYTPDGVPAPKPTFLGKPLARPEEMKRVWGEAEETRVLSEASPPTMKKRRRFRFGLLALGIFSLGSIAVASIFLLGFQRDNLTLRVLVKDRVESGERVVYQVFYKNDGNQTLKDLELNFTYPAGAVPLHEEKRQSGAYRTRVSLADLPSGAEAKAEFEARLFGSAGEVKEAEAVILYRLEKSSSRFSTKTLAQTVIARVPLELLIGVPEEVVSRQEVVLVVDYSSNAEVPFADMFLGVQYPQGFEFISADPAPTIGDGIWSLGAIEPGEAGKTTIRGRISGPPSEVKIFNAQIGLYREAIQEWTPYQLASGVARISVPLLSIEQRINEAREIVAHPGDELRFRLHYKNILDIPLRNVSVEVELLGAAFDLKTLRVEEGVFDGSRNVAVWNGASFPEFQSLAARKEGDLRFSVRLKPASSPEMANARNLAIESLARIASSDKPAGLEGIELFAEDTISAKIATRLVLSSRALYQNQYLPNSGLLPPKVGGKTTYAVIWQLANTLNDLANVEVHATLLPGVSWENLYVPSGQSVLFDPGSGVITWRAGNIAAGAGVSRSSPALAFRIGFTPAVNQVGQSPVLLRNIEASAIDTFTNEQVLIRGDELTTELRSDALTSEKDWKVVE